MTKWKCRWSKAVLILILVMLAIGAAAEAWSLKHAADGLSYDIRPSKSTVEPDEPFELVAHIKNASILPKTFIRINEMLPKGMSVADGGDDIESLSAETPDEACKHDPAVYSTMKNAGGKNIRVVVNGDRACAHVISNVFLLPKQKLARALSVKFSARGRYFLDGALITCGDFLGITSRTVRMRADSEIVVIPKRAEDTDFKRLLGGFLGDVSVKRFIFEDPVLTLGFREYTGAEPMKSVAWTKCTANDELLVKKYDYTLEPTASVVFNVETDQVRGNEFIALIERCFSIARTVCEALNSMGVKFSFATNARAEGAERIWPDSVDGLGRNHIMAIMEGLGRASYFPSERFTLTLDRAAKRAEQGRAHIIITPKMLPEYRAGIDKLKTMSGSDVCVICADAALDAAGERVGDR